VRVSRGTRVIAGLIGPWFLRKVVAGSPTATPKNLRTLGSLVTGAVSPDEFRSATDSLRAGLGEIEALSGEVQQSKRVKVLEAFRSGNIQVLVATDVAGRGIHIDDISYVVNYTLPEDPEDYIHRIGRTGRAGSKGSSISFACEDDSFLLPEIEQLLGDKLVCEHPPAELLSNS